MVQNVIKRPEIDVPDDCSVAEHISIDWLRINRMLVGHIRIGDLTYPDKFV